jgi:hypothetical protein
MAWLPSVYVTAGLAALTAAGIWSKGGGLGVATATAAGMCVLWGGLKIQGTRQYWSDCKAATLEPPGVQCSSWTKKAVWFRVNDLIMGGKSTSQLDADGAGRLVFSGEINTDGGGFASMRTGEDCHVVVPQGATAVRVVVEGDGQMWKVNLGLSHSLMDSKPTWTHDFLTTKGGKQTHTLPINAFTAQTRGRKVEGVVLDLDEVVYVGLILSLVDQEGRANTHFGAGPFRLTLHELEFEI